MVTEKKTAHENMKKAKKHCFSLTFMVVYLFFLHTCNGFGAEMVSSFSRAKLDTFSFCAMPSFLSSFEDPDCIFCLFHQSV